MNSNLFIYKSGKSVSTKYLNVEDIDDYEQTAVVNSPRSIEACLREGIRPEDLLYLPPSEFANDQNPQELNDLHYDYFEAKRKDLLVNVRKTRKKIIAHYQGQTRSSTLISFANLRNKYNWRERVKNVQAKFVFDKCLREEVVKKNLILKEVEHDLELEKHIDLNASLARRVKERTDKEIKMQNERKNKALKESEMLEEGKKIYGEKDYEQRMRVLEGIKEKIARIEKKRKRNEEKAGFYKEKLNEEQKCIRDLRVRKLEANDAEEKKRLGQLIFIKLQKQKDLQSIWDHKLEKSHKLKQKIKKEIQHRQDNYYEVKRIIDQHLQDRVKKSIGQEKSLEEITGKIPQVSDAILKENEHKKKQLEEKLNQDEKKVRKSKILKLKKREFNKKVKSLKIMKQSWNLQRIRNKEDYNKSLIKVRINQSAQKIEDLENKKIQDLSQTLQMNAKCERIKHDLSNEVEKMAIFKSWDQEKLLKIINFPRPKETFDF